MADEQSVSATPRIPETCIQTLLVRSGVGLTVRINALPKVEEFIRSLGDGSEVAVETIGRHWWSIPFPRDPNSAKVLGASVYQMTNNPGLIHLENEGFSFRLDKPGWPLTETPRDGALRYRGEAFAPGDEPYDGPARIPDLGPKETLNLSFLRLVGISRSEGVTFGVRGVFTPEQVDRLALQIEAATKKFYQTFLKPYKLVITVMTQAIPTGW
jgi:hypothetical protein